ncbi:MAG TPA: betaine-aldehyde dehydrogenase [Acetobacteraceae bacterium]|nr:betaine-aldehyde dehydrogenase [Acetobacteraceae bacterium]
MGQHVAPQPRRGAPDDSRRLQLIETTLDTLAECGFVGTTLARIAERAQISPGLIAHYFGDKDGLLEAAFRSVARRLARNVQARLAHARTPRERVQAVIDANLGTEEFDQRVGSVWLAFWGQVPHQLRLNRVQMVYQRRMLSNLRHGLNALVPREQAEKLAAMTAAMIDGVWLRAALSGWAEADSESARRLLTSFLDSCLAGAPRPAPIPAPAILRRDTRYGLTRAYIGGRSVDAHGDLFETIDPATGEVIAQVQAANAADVDAAVAAARRGQTIWAAMTGAERGRILRRAADKLREHNAELAEIETRDTGKPIQETSVVDILSGADCLEYFGAQAATMTGEQVDLGSAAFGYTRREPLGVVAGIGAWNYPIQIACWKAAPALACGNAMLFKPAELTPLTAVRLAEILSAAGLPDGVFNVVQGFGDTGRMLTAHPDIRKVSLTGEVGTGKAVMRASADSLKAVTLELGGKSPLIICDDADLDEAVSGALLGNFYSAGEVCSNATRVFVHARVHDAFIERLLRRVAPLKVGDPMDPATQIGALISEPHMRKVLSYIERGKAEGANLLTGGYRVTADALARGNFVAPTVFDSCTDNMTIVREEIFGPVMSVLTYEDEDEVIARANDTEFGLAAGVFTRDLQRGHRMIARLQAGTCWLNTYNITPIELPFGGVKLSGIGRENSRAALEHYSQIKSVYVAMSRIDAPY